MVLRIVRQETNVVCDKESDNSKENSDESLVEEQVSQDKSSFVESSPNADKETIFPVNKKVEFTKPKNHEKPVKKSARKDLHLDDAEGTDYLPTATIFEELARMGRMRECSPSLQSWPLIILCASSTLIITLDLFRPIKLHGIAIVALPVCEVGLRWESDGFVLGCRGRGERDDE
ncbi:hypothetical protein Tco_0287673 [Tanacetum coccineum]